MMENTNQGDGVVLTKYAVPHTDQNGVPDGTIDVVLQAYTSGRVVQTSTTTPADIVLVLDLSGSMEDRQGSTTVTNYTPEYAEENYYSFGSYVYGYSVGLGTSSTRYVKIGDRYVSARRNTTDSQGFEVWRYTDGGNTVYFYPALASGETPLRNPANSYPTLQVYRQTTTTIQGEKKIDLLKEAVDSFIDHTAESNAGIANDADKHRVALVKFASAEYYNNSNLIAEGDHKDSDNYNYSEVVKGFTTVNTAGATTLKNAMDAMTSGGATAVDYGLNLAIKLFEAQDEATESQRNKVVIVFTDGSPTHASNYQASVAGSAINYAKTLKDEGVTVYTLSVENGADGSQLGSSNSNKFMHYASSNYPEASYSGANIVEGAGGASRGYYLTPDTSHSLEMLFEAISSEIGAPTISMGTESVLTDTVSEYFEVAGGINGVSVYTSLRNPDDTWAPAAVDTSLIPVVDGNIVSVKGFEFDEHYISEQPRRIGSDDYYGKALILSINVTPD
ncbi:MAG: VWA domain-containing protein, partial [Clostridia bacterium]|nr:VWA domain-containing protein [Clostridia bacterium]